MSHSTQGACDLARSLSQVDGKLITYIATAAAGRRVAAYSASLEMSRADRIRMFFEFCGVVSSFRADRITILSPSGVTTTDAFGLHPQHWDVQGKSIQSEWMDDREMNAGENTIYWTRRFMKEMGIRGVDPQERLVRHFASLMNNMFNAVTFEMPLVTLVFHFLDMGSYEDNLSGWMGELPIPLSPMWSMGGFSGGLISNDDLSDEDFDRLCDASILVHDVECATFAVA